MLPDLLDTSVSCFVVRIWGGQEELYQLLIEWKVNLDGLRYTGQQVSEYSYTVWMAHARTLRFNLLLGICFSQIRSRNPNEIIFGLNDGYYAADFDQKVRHAVCFVRIYLIMSCFNCLVSVGIRFSKHTISTAVAGSVRAEEKQFASG